MNQYSYNMKSIKKLPEVLYMDALRRNLKELRVILVKLPLLKTLLVRSKHLLGVGTFLWILGSLLPDTAHFTVTLFCSAGRFAIFIGLFLAFVNAEYQFIMIISTLISLGCLMVIIIELAAISYLASFETFLFIAIFGGLAINTSKYLNNQWYEEQVKKDKPTSNNSDYISTSYEPDSSIKIETVPQDSYVPDTPAVKMEYVISTETPVQETAPVQEASAYPKNYYAKPIKTTQETPNVQEVYTTVSNTQSETAEEITPQTSTETNKPATQRRITVTPSKTKSTRLSDIKRAPSIDSAPSIGRAPSVTIKPKE